MNKNKRRFLLVMVLAFILTSCMFPTMCFAANGAEDIDITMDDDGAINISGGDDSIDFNDASQGSAWTAFYAKYKAIIVGISGVATMTMLAAFIFLFTKLGVVSANETARSRVIVGLLFTGIATAALGSVTIIFGFFYNAM